MKWTATAGSFDSIAEAYDRARPSYPQEVFDRILEYAQLSHVPGDILEIGAGTGKATRPFALLGHRLLCLEPGPNLARFARAQFARLSNVVVEEVSFEDWQPDAGRFDLAFSAQAFHWLEPGQRLPKLAKVIRKASPFFEALDFHVVEWSRELSCDAYGELLGTYSDHLALPAAERESLLGAVRDAVFSNGDSIRLDYRTGLFLARVA